MKRIFIFGFLFVVALAIAGGVAFKLVSQSGSGVIEQWIGSQLQAIANSYLNPQLKFTDLDYTYPYTVSLKDLTLKAEDPANPGQTIDIIACSAATLTLAEIPAVGKPVIIEKIVLDKPLISIVSVEPRSRKFVGFSNLLQVKPGPTTAVASAAPTTRPRLSEVFQMRLIQLTDGRIVYNPRIPGTEPMELDQINTTLKIEPSETGWYKLNTALSRKPIFDLSLAGDLNLDSFSARAMNVQLNADLAHEKLSYLPPQLQKILKKYEVSGAFKAVITGDLPIMQPAKGTVQTDVKLHDANVTFGEYKIPVKSLDLAANMKDGVLNLSGLKIDALRGVAQMQGSMVMNDKLDTDLKLTVAAVRLEDLLASRKEGDPLKLAGKLDATVQAKASLTDVMAKARVPATKTGGPLPAQWGSGSVELTEGQLVSLRLFKNLNETIGAAMKIVSAGRLADTPKDRAKVVFAMESDQAKITDFKYVGEFVAARGTGTIGLDRAMDLSLRAGPVERMQAMLGETLGGAIGAVTDSVLSYRVTGTIGDTKVEPVIAGGVVGNGVEGVGRGIERIGEGIGNIFKPAEQK